MNSTENTTFSLDRSNGTRSVAFAQYNTFHVTNVYITVSVLGTVGNALGLIVICTHKPLRKRLSNYYIINQMVVNLLASLMLVPANLTFDGYLSTVFCVLWDSKFFYGSLYTLSIYCAVLLSVERYLQVVYPIKHRVHVTKRKVLISIILTWTMVIVEKTMFLLITARSTNGVCTKWFGSQTIQITAGFLNCVFDYVLPLVVTALGYVLMIRTLQSKVQPQPTATGNRGPTVPSNVNAGMSRAKKNILVTLLLIIICFVICNSFKQALILVILITGSYPYYNFAVAQLMASLNSMVDPYICLFFLQEFRVGMLKLFHVPERFVSSVTEAKSGKNQASFHNVTSSAQPSMHDK